MTIDWELLGVTFFMLSSVAENLERQAGTS